MRDAVKAELDEMVSQGIIQKVDEPTDWGSSIVYVRKSYGKLRLCLDPKEEYDLNLRKLIETARTAGLTSSSSSSYRAASTDITDPLSPLLPVVHRLRQVFRATSRILT